MTWEFVFFSSPDYLRVNVNGSFRLDYQARMFEEIPALDGWRPCIPILFDNCRLEMKDVDTPIIQHSVKIMHNFCRRHPDTKIAGLVGSMVNFGFGRQFETYNEIEGGTGFRLFKDEAAALEWLLTSGSDDAF